VKSSKVSGTWCFAFERFRYKPSPVSPPGLLEGFFCNVRVYLVGANRIDESPALELLESLKPFFTMQT
jgi:hypothetical protein